MRADGYDKNVDRFLPGRGNVLFSHRAQKCNVSFLYLNAGAAYQASGAVTVWKAIFSSETSSRDSKR